MIHAGPRQVPQAAAPEIVLSGRSNAGKSTLLNEILGASAGWLRFGSRMFRTLCLGHFSGFHRSWMTAPGANGLKKAAPTSVKGGRTRTLNWYPIGFDEPIGSLDTLRRFFFTFFWWVYTGYIGYTGAWDEHPTEAGPEMVYGWVPGAVTTKPPSWLDMVKDQGCNPNCMGLLHRKKSLKCWRPKCKRERERVFICILHSEAFI